MPIDNWDEIRTAFQVARLGTVSGAAEALGVHHATVIRHIDALEGRLGVKLFQRHARGYTPTEAGQDLLQVAQATADQFDQLSGRLHGHGARVTGDLVITSLEILSPLISPVLSGFRQEHADLTVKFLTGTRLFRLEYGEAHVAIRAGSVPQEPDNVVQPLYTQAVAFYGTPEYAEANGQIDFGGDFSHHRFVGTTEDAPRAPFFLWMNQHVPDEQVVYRVSDVRAGRDAVMAGAGAGFVPTWWGETQDNLIRLSDALEEWKAQIWLITHVDLHRTAKVQAFTNYIKDAAKDWPDL